MFGRHKKVMLEAGSRAPSFQIKKLDGAAMSLEQILTKGPALLAFYKVSCPICQLTFPYLERLAGGTRLQVVGISQDDSSATQSFNQRFGLTLPTLLDSPKEDYPASNGFGITAVPSLFVVEPDGKISKSFSGFSKRELEALGERAGVKTFRPEESVPEWKSG